MEFIRIVFSIIPYILLAGLLFFIYPVIQRLSSSNPFERTLKRPAYMLRKSIGRFDYEISFTEKATTNSLRESLLNIQYRENNTGNDLSTVSIQFTNFQRWNIITGYFAPLHFKAISFEDIDIDHFNCIDYFRLPCKELYLPTAIKDIDFSIDSIPHIESLVLNSQHLVPLRYYSDTYFSDPIRVSKPLNISVPNHLLRAYRTDPGWRSVRLVTPEGNIITPTFNGLEPYDPASVPYFHL